MWERFENGATIGKRGSEGGVIVLDDEHVTGARITLERDCAAGVPFAITCGVYGWFFHTRFLGSEAKDEYPVMRDALAAILNLVPRADDPDAESMKQPVIDAIDRFVTRFP